MTRQYYTPSDDRPWISIRAAADRLGVPEFRIKMLMEQGFVDVLRLPGSKPLVSAADLDRLRDESIKPARRPEPAGA
jgi:hypothetical protein